MPALKCVDPSVDVHHLTAMAAVVQPGISANYIPFSLKWVLPSISVVNYYRVIFWVVAVLKPLGRINNYWLLSKFHRPFSTSSKRSY
ncbi:hypothetical protein MIH18_23685 (plasmid) [Marinobacter sp. M3C]|uniref:hypothetical protein n=1 Tax=Marinobacter sp. M3C TaxID=2917715 RepID=UPI00200D8288|nr:hypothetical protein [Marinobacter sp. M3C]MCL1485142.1 hypothetical protein [Marinobacter sp.]UQG62834.1 hypothetical protein MIH18_23685 [Marinobacter sp. M3C]